MWTYLCITVLISCFSFTSGILTAEELTQFHESVIISLDGDAYAYYSDGMPTHEYNDSVNPNTATAQNYTGRITASPSTDGLTCTTLGAIGFAKNGVPLYNALTGPMDGYQLDAVKNEDFDNCHGHSAPNGDYHYHQFPGCVGTHEEVDEFIGVAVDGHPIYGPYASDVEGPLTSADLDACHGRMVDNRYRYHVTYDFPYIVGCYRGTPYQFANSGAPGGDGQGPPGGDGQGPPGGGGQGPPPGRRRKRQEDATCMNTQGSAELCDCDLGTLQECDINVAGGSCDGDSNVDDNSGETTTSQAVHLEIITSLLFTSVMMMILL